MEKQGIINEENTPPEQDGLQKSSNAGQGPNNLASHVTQRAADIAAKGCCGGKCKTAEENNS